MKAYSRIYLVEDGFGQRASASCEESCDTIQISGLQNSGEENQYFESDAYHLEEWCRVNEFKYKCIEKEYDFDQLWIEQYYAQRLCMARFNVLYTTLDFKFKNKK